MGPQSRELLSRLTRADLSTRPSRSGPAARSTSATPRSAPPGSPTSASSAGSCTSRPSSRSACTRTCCRAGAGPRRRQRRLLRDRLAPAREGLPRVRPRADPRLHAGRRRPAVRLQAEDRHPVPRARAPSSRPRRPGARRKLVSFVGRRPGRDAVGRRAGAPRRRPRRAGHLGGLGRDASARASASPTSGTRPAGPIDADWVRAASYAVAVGSDVLTGSRCRCARSSTPKGSRTKA